MPPLATAATTACAAADLATTAAAAFGVVIVALQLYPYLTSFPHPYSGLTASPTDPGSVARFPEFPPDLSGAFMRNEQLAQHAIRLFQGRVLGAESVAVAPDGTLIMLDKYLALAKNQFCIGFLCHSSDCCSRLLITGAGTVIFTARKSQPLLASMYCRQRTTMLLLYGTSALDARLGSTLLMLAQRCWCATR